MRIFDPADLLDLPPPPKKEPKTPSSPPKTSPKIILDNLSSSILSVNQAKSPKGPSTLKKEDINGNISEYHNKLSYNVEHLSINYKINNGLDIEILKAIRFGKMNKYYICYPGLFEIDKDTKTSKKKIFKMNPYQNIVFWANNYDNDDKHDKSQFIKYIFEPISVSYHQGSTLNGGHYVNVSKKLNGGKKR